MDPVTPRQVRTSSPEPVRGMVTQVADVAAQAPASTVHIPDSNSVEDSRPQPCSREEQRHPSRTMLGAIIGQETGLASEDPLASYGHLPESIRRSTPPPIAHNQTSTSTSMCEGIVA